jgi:hypothetical protein
VAAVGELQQEFTGRIDFVIVSPEETEARGDELVEYELGSHGLVAFDAEGEVRAHLPGHEFGREEILGVIAHVLPQTTSGAR